MSTLHPDIPTHLTPAEQRAYFLAYGNLLRVFGERDAEKRKSAISRIYSTDTQVFEANPSGTKLISTHEGIDQVVEALLGSEDNKDWDFVPLGPIRLNAAPISSSASSASPNSSTAGGEGDFVFLPWGFGPRNSGTFGSGDKEGVEVKVTGSDHIVVGEDGKIGKLWVVIDGLSDVKV